MAYLIDANVFIEAKNRYYGFDICPAFRDWLIAANADGTLFSVEKVGEEIRAGDDRLAEWAAERGEGFFVAPPAALLAAAARIDGWTAAQGYAPAAAARSSARFSLPVEGGAGLGHSRRRGTPREARMSVAEYVRPEMPAGNFRGASKARRPPPDPLLTETGPGTPCGEYLRAFWWPVGMTEEVPGDLPFRTRLLGEDLVLFRTRRGDYGCLHLNCSHRNTSLEFGRVTERGIRCCYHGWEYAIDGTILDTPGEPAGSRIRERVFHGAYPVIEFKGLLFVYMGPRDGMPEFPVYDTFNLADDELAPYSISYPANWLQIAENTTDPYHTVFLHANHSTDHFEASWGEIPVIDWHEHENGRHTCNVCAFRWKDKVWVRVYETFFPSFSQVGSFFETAEDEKYFQRAAITKWTVPVDDTTTRITAWRHFGEAIDPHGQGRRELVGKDTVDFLGQTADRPYEERQRVPSDYEAQVGQGVIAPHGAENLGHTDRGVAILRRNLRAGIERVRNGEPPVRPPQNGEEVPSWCSDTIIPLPAAPGEDDEELRRRVSGAIVEVLRSADGMPRGERTAWIEAELARIKDRPEFARPSPAG